MSRQLADASASAETTTETVLEAEKASFLKQPKAVWATALAAVFAFMGIGLVDPILPAIAKNLEASTSEVSLLFTSYFLVTAIAMLISGFVSSRIGGKKTLLIGLAIIVVFASLSGLSGSVEQLVGFRAGWGLGNALFVATALAVIVGGGQWRHRDGHHPLRGSTGFGHLARPAARGLLGGWQWRAPFFGTAVLMAAAFIALLALLPKTAAPAKKSRLRIRCWRSGIGGLRTTAASALFYNYGFFTILAFTPFILGMDAYGIGGAVFFGWGGVAVAVFSVFVAPVLQKRLGAVKVLTGTLAALMLDLIGLGLAAGHSVTAVVVLVIAAGAFWASTTRFTRNWPWVSLIHRAPLHPPATTLCAGWVARLHHSQQPSWVSTLARRCRSSPVPLPWLWLSWSLSEDAAT